MILIVGQAALPVLFAFNVRGVALDRRERTHYNGRPFEEG